MRSWGCRRRRSGYARALKSRAFSVRGFVEHRDRAEQLSEKLDHVTVLAGDPTDATTFADEHIGKADVFVAVTVQLLSLELRPPYAPLPPVRSRIVA